ncbi:MAG TPA: type II toxin-antitoxin system prevent-host-death family antitoxin [Actinomycetales bacterium]|nr:type II toxin-antitoxin system prevent-host-death family antitoxin [Actinomycetales bacterium]
MEVTVQEAKTHLSRLLRRVEAGETVIIRRGPVRVAMLSPAPVVGDVRTIWGNLAGRLGEDFDAPLEDFAGYTD